jgi:PadR family transcriptional regulator AphA
VAGNRVELLPGEWAVLGVLAQDGPSHGFAVARELTPEAALGSIWTVARSRVYRVIDDLIDQGLARGAGVASGNRGPRRTLVEATTTGYSALEAWLETPVDHVRDLRAELLLKLALLHRGNADPGRLLRAQRTTLRAMARRLEQRVAAAEGFDRVVAAYRVETVRGALRFVEGQLGSG